jgi:hypothetical protein
VGSGVHYKTDAGGGNTVARLSNTVLVVYVWGRGLKTSALASELFDGVLVNKDEVVVCIDEGYNDAILSLNVNCVIDERAPKALLCGGEIDSTVAHKILGVQAPPALAIQAGR